jgi:NAD(P)-dependent dehydrogenase (short-subunit alcohol dehydrogenase family)
LADRGYRVYAGVRRDKDVGMITELGKSNLFPLLVDVSSHPSCVQAIEFLTQETQRLGLPFVALVNNAGVSRKLPVEFHELSDAKRVFDTNYFGVLDMVQLSLPLLRKSQGRIIMTSSITGFIGIFLLVSVSPHHISAPQLVPSMLCTPRASMLWKHSLTHCAESCLNSTSPSLSLSRPLSRLRSSRAVNQLAMTFLVIAETR